MCDMKIIYIGGYGRSGSTLVDLLIGQHKNIASGGELVHVVKDVQKNKLCTCGEHANHCMVWKRFKKYLQNMNSTDINYNKLNNSKKNVESLKTLMSIILGLKIFQPPKKNIDSFILIEESLDYAFSGAGYFQFRIDSSKSARLATARALSLKHFALKDVYFIHLIRHPLGVASSLKKGCNRKLEAGLASGGTLFMFRGLLSWGISNIVALLTRMKLGRNKSICLDFDELLSSPEKIVQEIFKLLKLEDNGVIQYVKGNQDQAPLHILSGNRMRNQQLALSKRYNPSNNLNFLERLFIIFFCKWIKLLCHKI